MAQQEAPARKAPQTQGDRTADRKAVEALPEETQKWQSNWRSFADFVQYIFTLHKIDQAAIDGPFSDTFRGAEVTWEGRLEKGTDAFFLVRPENLLRPEKCVCPLFPLVRTLILPRERYSRKRRATSRNRSRRRMWYTTA
jgi:hypothetical protein